MAVPSTNISMQGIATEAGGVSITNIYASDLFKKSYFEGPNGTYNISYNAWGQYGNSSGADRIYGLTTKNTNNAWSDFSGLTYFYENTTYKCEASANNSMPTPSGLDNNDVSIQIELYDSTSTYLYVSNSFNCPQGTSPGSVLTSGTGEPIIARGYWVVIIQTFQFGGTMNFTLDINGTNYISTVALSPNTTQQFDFNTYGVADIAYDATMGATGLYFFLDFAP